MVFMDRSLLTFDLVTRLSQVIKSANSSDINASNKIIEKLLDSCRCLQGDCRLLSTLEQSTIMLLLNLATTHENVRLKIMPPLLQILFSIESNTAVWCEKFESDFGKTFLLQLLKCDACSGSTGGGNRVSTGILGQLELILARVTTATTEGQGQVGLGGLGVQGDGQELPREMVIIQGMFEVIGEAPQYPWTEFFRSIVNFSQRAIRLSAPFSQLGHFQLAHSVLSACIALVTNAARSESAPGQETNMKTAQLLLPQLVELASATLSGSLENNGLKKMAILLLAACASLNKNYLEIAFQQGLKLLRGVSALGIGYTVGHMAEGKRMGMGVEDEEDEDEGEYVLAACSEILLAVDIVKALHASITVGDNGQIDPDSAPYLTSLAHQLSRATLHLHSTGRLHQFESTPVNPPSSTAPSSPSSTFEMINPCSELKLFSSAFFLVLRDEAIVTGLNNSVCKRFFQVAFEYCFGPDISAVPLGTGLGVISPSGRSPSITSRDPAVIGDSSRISRLSESSHYTSYRMVSLIGSGVEGIALPTVFDLVYPGLADLLARSNLVPQLSLVLSCQMSKLAVSSLSERATTVTGSGSGVVYLDLVVECLCSSYSRTVSRMKHHPVAVGGGSGSNGVGGGESSSVVSVTSTPKKVTRSIIGSITRSATKGKDRGSRDGSVAGSYSVAGSVNGSRNGSYMDALKDDISHGYGRSEKGGTGDKGGTKSVKKVGGSGGAGGAGGGGETGEEDILLTVLEGLVGGLDSLVMSLRGQGEWGRVRALRGRLMECFTALATEVYGTDGVSSDSTFGGSALGLLLLPMASAFREADPGLVIPDLASDKDSISMAAFRSLWTTFALFRIKESSAWAEHPSWLPHLQLIAAMTPPLLYTGLKPSTVLGGTPPSESQTRGRSASSVSIGLESPSSTQLTQQTQQTQQSQQSQQDTIAQTSVLFDFSSASSILDKELSYNPVLKGFLSPPTLASTGGAGAAVGSIRDKKVLAALRTVVRFSLTGLTAGQAVFLVSVQFLESLRVGGGTLDLTPLMVYLGDPALDSSLILRDALVAIADHVFSVFIEASLARLRDPRVCMIKGADLSPSQSLLKVRQTIAKVFYFFVVRCSHNHPLVRSTALRFSGRMLDRMTWLVSDTTGVSLMLNTLNQLAEHSMRLTSLNAAPTPSSLTSTLSSTLPSLSPTHNSPHAHTTTSHLPSPTPTLLPPSLLPSDSSGVSEASLPLLEMAYSWLFSGMRSVPSEISAVLQEYILVEQSDASASSSHLGITHLGIAVAKEAASNRMPVYHVAPPTGESILSGPRSLAAFKIASQLPSRAPSPAANMIAAAFASQLALKSRFKGELQGLQSRGSVKGEGYVSPFKAAITSYLSGSFSPAATLSGLLYPPFTPDGKNKKEEENKGGYKTFLDVASEVEEGLKCILQADWGLKTRSLGSGKGLEGAEGADVLEATVELLVRDMWRAAAVVNMLSKEPTGGAGMGTNGVNGASQFQVQGPNQGLSIVEREAMAIRIVQLLCVAPCVYYSVQTMDCLVAVLQWLLVSNPTLRRVITAEVTAMFVDTSKRGLGLFCTGSGEAERAGEAKSLCAAGSYSERLLGSVSDEETAEALRRPTGRGRESSTADSRKLERDRLSDPRPHESLILFLDHLLRTDAFNISLAPVFQCISTLLAQHPATHTHTSAPSSFPSNATAMDAISTSPQAVTGRFRLLCLGLRVGRKCLTIPGAASGPRRRVLRERVVKCCLDYFESKPVWIDLKAPPVSSVAAFSSLWDFLALLLEDSRTWTVEYPKGGHGSGPQILIEHQGESGKFMGRKLTIGGRNEARDADKAVVTAGNYLQRGRGVGASGAINYLRSAIAGYESSSLTSPVDNSLLPVTVTAAQGELGMFCPLVAPIFKPFTAPVKSKRLNTPSASIDSEKGGMASGVLCLVKMLVLNELDRVVAWMDADCVSEQSRAIAAAEFKLISTDVKAYKLAVRSAWAVSPLLAVALRDRFPLSASLDGRVKGISCLSSLAVESPEGLRLSYAAVGVLVEGIVATGVKMKKKKSHVSTLDAELSTQDLLLWASAPVPVVIRLLSRLGGKGKGQSSLHLHPGVTRYCARSLSVADPDSLAFFAPQLVQLLRGEVESSVGGSESGGSGGSGLLGIGGGGDVGEGPWDNENGGSGGAIAGLLLELAKGSALLCHRLVGLLQIEANSDGDTTHTAHTAHSPHTTDDSDDMRDISTHSITPHPNQHPHSLAHKKSRYGHCKSLKGTDPLPLIAQRLLAQIKSTLTPSEVQYLEGEREFFDRITDISATLKGVKNKVIADAVTEIIQTFTSDADRLYLPTAPDRKLQSVEVTSGIPMQSAAKCPFLLSFITSPWGGPDEALKTPGSGVNKGHSHDLAVYHIKTLTNQAGYEEQEASSASNPSSPLTPTLKKPRGIGKKSRLFTIPKTLRFNIDDKSVSDVASCDDVAVSVIEQLEQGEGAESGAEGGADGGINTEIPSTALVNSSTALAVPERTSPRSLSILPRSPIKGSLLPRWMPSPSVSPMSPSGPSGPSMSPSRSIPPPRPASLLRGSADGSTETADSVRRDACIFKVYDDCRQDSLVIQVVRVLRDAFLAAGLPLYLVPYSVIPCRTGADKALGGIIQVIPNVKSRDHIGKAGAKDILDYFTAQFGAVGSPGFKRAQRAFVNSMAGYAVVCYLLNIKDRHNGNLLIDNVGHAIHIDYGFILGISPGGNLGFETAAFKITADMVALMGGQGGEVYQQFEDLVVRGFLIARSVSEEVCDIVAALADSGLPCFMHKDDNLGRLRGRFMANMSCSEAAKSMRGKVTDAADKWTTKAYDGIQKLQNNIY